MAKEEPNKVSIVHSFKLLANVLARALLSNGQSIVRNLNKIKKKGQGASIICRVIGTCFADYHIKANRAYPYFLTDYYGSYSILDATK